MDFIGRFDFTNCQVEFVRVVNLIPRSIETQGFCFANNMNRLNKIKEILKKM